MALAQVSTWRPRPGRYADFINVCNQARKINERLGAQVRIWNSQLGSNANTVILCDPARRRIGVRRVHRQDQRRRRMAAARHVVPTGSARGAGAEQSAPRAAVVILSKDRHPDEKGSSGASRAAFSHTGAKASFSEPT